MTNFVHLHLHSEYSLLDGACRITEIPAAVKNAGGSACAITDHGVMYGAVDFYRACKAAGVKPIIGCEIYVAPASRFEKEKNEDGNYSHLILLCKNRTGYENLIKIVSKAFTEGFYSKPRADIELLGEHHEGLIALSACLSGYIPKHILSGDTSGAKKHALLLNEIFGQGNFYLELQDHGLREQKTVNTVLCGMSDALGIPLVATNDVHYLLPEDAENQEILMAIQMNKTLADRTSFAFGSREFYLKDGDKMAALFADRPDAVANTVKIAEECNFDFEFDKLFLPAFYPPDKLSSKDYLEKLCREGLQRRFDQMDAAHEPYDKAVYEERLAYELDVVVRMGYAEYYLIVNDFISFAKGEGIPVGPGRGSGAGSLAAFALGITDVNPIKYGLLFERFLNPERVSMPDFDVDFCYERRGEVIDYVARKYGKDHVAQIVTFGTMAARQAIRDVGRVMGLTYAEVDSVAKNVPFAIGMTLDRAMNENKVLADIYESDPTLRHMIDVAKRLEGMPRHASIHAAGVVITDKPVSDYVPLAENRGAVVTQFTMNTIADLGLLKIDFLGLRYLTVISDAEKAVRRKEPDFDITRVSLSDEKTYRLIGSGNTDGVFQLESGGMKSLLCRMKPESIEDITAAISLYRPGPMESIPKYLENRKHPEKIKYAVPALASILDVTNGCIVYQEQVMQIFRTLAGYSFGRADIVRRAMSKKKIAVMEKEREYFLYGKKRADGSTECTGALANGVPEDAAKALYDEMSEFAKYAFNKSHAACYAFLSYRTAYLKAHYPKEYMCALTDSVLDRTDKVAFYIDVCKSLGLRILPPDINKSFATFRAGDGEESIRFGLLAVKGVGRSFIDKVVKERENGAFRSLEDFLTRMPQGEVNKHMLECLIKSGAFDGFGKKRSQLLAVYESAVDALARRNRMSVSGQYDMFSAMNADGSDSFGALHIDYPDIPELDIMERLGLEKEVAGIYLTGHPLERYSETAKAMNAVKTSEIAAAANPAEGETPPLHEKDTITILGLVTAKKITATKNGSRMAFLTVEDEVGSMEAILFPKRFEMLNTLLETGKVAALTGELTFKDTDETGENGELLREGKLLVSRAVPAAENGKLPLTAQETAVIHKESTAQSGKFTVSFAKLGQGDAFSGEPGKAPEKPRRSVPQKQAESDSHRALPPLKNAEGGVLCVYLRLSAESCPEFLRVRRLLEIFEYGTTPVFLHFAAENKTVKLSRGIFLNPTMLALLSDILGKDNVKTAYRKLTQ